MSLKKKAVYSLARSLPPSLISHTKHARGWPNRNPSAGINKIELAQAHQLLVAATDDGFVHLWDARQGQSGGGRTVASLDLREAVGATAVNAAEQTVGGFQVRERHFGWEAGSMKSIVYLMLRLFRPIITAKCSHYS